MEICVAGGNPFATKPAHRSETPAKTAASYCMFLFTGCPPPASLPRALMLTLTGVFAGRTTSSPRAMKVE